MQTKHKILSITATTVFATLLTAAAVFATTTIGTGILTGGTLEVTGATTLNGTTTLGDAIADTTIVKSRIATTSAAGAVINTGASYAYGEGMEMRYAVDDWTLIPDKSFKGYYFRTETTKGDASGDLRGMEVYSVANIASGTTGLEGISGLYSELLVKLPLSSYTIAGYPSALEATFAYDAAAAGKTTTITNGVAAIVAKIQTATGLNSYTNLDGIRIIGRDADAVRVMGDALTIEGDPTVGSNATWTNGIKIAVGATAGINITAAAAAASAGGIFIGEASNSAQSGIPLHGATFDTGNGLYCDDDGVALTGYTECFTSRMLITTTVATGDISTVAIHPDLVIDANYTGTGGLSSIWGNTTIASGKAVNLVGSLGDVSGGTFGVDIVGTLAANSHAAGVSVGVGGSGTKTGILTGFRIRGATGTVDWDGVFSIEDGDGSWTSMTATGGNTATMTNSPKTGNPAYWLKIYIGETEYSFPVWAD